MKAAVDNAQVGCARGLYMMQICVANRVQICRKALTYAITTCYTSTGGVHGVARDAGFAAHADHARVCGAYP